MALPQNPNQFKQSVIKGSADLRFNTSVISAQIDSTEAGELVAGQAVKLVDSAGGIPKVVAVSADTDKTFGFIVYNQKDQVYKAFDKCEIVFSHSSVIYLEAGAAIPRGGDVMVLVAGAKVVTATGTGKVVVGQALDKALADGDLIRVVVNLPGAVLA